MRDDPSLRVVGVIPAYNEASHVEDVVRRAQRLVWRVVVVDDGSADGTAVTARSAGAIVISHVTNRGLGGALRTGIKAALALGAHVIVTLDSDGQHEPEDIPRLTAPIIAGSADFVVGCRLFDPKGMPPIRRVANRLADLTTWLLLGARLQDTQSGFRAFSRKAAEALAIRSSRMEVSSEIAVQMARRGFRILYVPIQAKYTDYSLSKGQSFVVGLQTLARLLLRRPR